MTPDALDSLHIALDPLGQAGIALSLIFIVFGVALGLRTSDFIFLRTAPVLFFGGVASQIVVLPLVTFLLVLILAPPPSIALGMMVVASCPGGASSNFLTFLARGNVAYSVSLTATSSIAAALLTPALILFWSSLYAPTAALLDTIEVNPLSFLIQTTILLALPLVAGMTVAHFRPGLADRYRKHIARAGVAILAGVIVYGTWSLLPRLFAALPLIAPIAILHNAVAFACGAAAGRLLGADGPTRRALTFEVGIQNSGLALVILIGQLAGLGGAAAIAAAWGVWHLIAGGIIVLLFRRLDRREGNA